MPIPSSIVIIGAGAAGGQAALTLRRLGYDGRVTLVGAEPLPPYERPPLSKEVLTSNAAPMPALLAAEDLLAGQGVETALGARVQELDIRRRCIRLSNRPAPVFFDRLLIATGASARRLSIEGSELGGIHYLRSWSDSLALRRELQSGGRVVVIGGGFIGLEVAASARRRGCTVTVIEAAPQLMGRAVPEIVSQVFAQKHRAEGVTIELSRRPVRVLGNEVVHGVELEDGSVIAADVVVVGIGSVPETALASEAGLSIDDGIVVDSLGRTSAEDVFAAGDCCRVRQNPPARGIRHESWQSALDQGDRAAHAMIERSRAPSDVPWVWSDQYEYNLQIAGTPDRVESLVIRGDPQQADFICFQLHEQRVVGAVAVNRGGELAMAKRLIAASAPVSATALADSRLRLKSLLPKSKEE